MLRKLLLSVLFINLFGCSSDNDTPTNELLYQYIQDWYLWEADLPTDFNPNSYSDIYQTLEALRDSRDRFSFIQTAEEYQDFRASIFFGYGFSAIWNENDTGLLVRMVLEEGSAAQNGLRRGDTITEVNDESVSSISARIGSGETTFSEVLGPNEDGYTIDVKYQKPDGEVIATQFSKSSIEANTVLHSETKSLANSQDTVGYLVFDSFDSKSAQELNTVFDQFVIDDVEHLILDLRYNTGGLVRIANQLSTQIAGEEVTNRIFTRYVHNDKQASQNRTVRFSIGAGIERLNLEQVVVLTTDLTCSASELVINSLTPFIDVQVIGTRTCGKPTGFYPEPIGDYVVFATNFTGANADGFGEYYDGLSVDCEVQDQITGDWGVNSDPLLLEGLNYLQTGQCGQSSESKTTISILSDCHRRFQADFRQGPIKAKNLF